MNSVRVFLLFYWCIAPLRWLGSVMRPLTSRLILSVYVLLKPLYVWRTGRSLPPPQAYKKAVVRHYAQTHALRNFIETGTYLGNMIAATKDLFDHTYSIELSPDLWQAATARFAGDIRVKILHGDSGELLPKLLQHIHTPCLFWLDGHYSGGITACGITETPIIAELQAALTHRIRNHVILIDDAQCFTGEHGYPTLDELRTFVVEQRSDCAFEVMDEIIRIYQMS